MNRRISIGVLLLLFLLMSVSTVSAQQRLKFSVKDFSYDAFDQTARDERFKKIDGSGSLYAIVKVTGDSSDDDLLDYRFNFGNMNHLVEDHDGELWLYVQKNAKMVTISRSGYITLSHYDLRTTLEEGKVYRMVLSAQGPVVYTQMVMFTVTPADSKAVVTIMREDSGQEEMLGAVNDAGAKAKDLPLGTYTYKIMAENYHSSEGRFILNNQTETHQEKVTLRPRFSMITLSVEGQAEILVNGELKGKHNWTGLLNAGNYQVECRLKSHKSSFQTISVEENQAQSYQLLSPTPITGTLSVISEPFEAQIVIDGKDYGKTPRNIANLLIGKHSVTISKEGYAPKTEECDIRENETQSLELTLEKSQVTTVPQGATSEGDKTFTVGGVSFTMKSVVGGTFIMGDKGRHAQDEEIPAHQVTLSDYYIGETEVTQALWQAVMGSNPSYFKGSNLPVESVSWDDCQVFVSKLNALTGQKFRLPTEAEWEWAARGGWRSHGYEYSGYDRLDYVGWFWQNCGDSWLTAADVQWNADRIKNNQGKTHSVKQKEANELGLYDMSGNIYEWCQDLYGTYSSLSQTNPTGPSSGSSRVLRGGSWYNKAMSCRVSARSSKTENSRYSHIGLRLALTSEESISTTVPQKLIGKGDTTFTVGGVSFTMKPVEGGSFTMGATSEQGSDVDGCEKPTHQVTLSSFFIGETEVTQELWEIVMGNNPSSSIGRNLPVNNVSWGDCQEFIRKLYALTGQKFRLPTEAEWEYAARGGTKSRGYKYSGSNNLKKVGWYHDNGRKINPVKQKKANEIGLYDMSGNVTEWCQDWYGDYRFSAQTNPIGASWGSYRVCRGGCWMYIARGCRVSYRKSGNPVKRDSSIGFRLAL